MAFRPDIDIETVKSWCREVGDYQLDNFERDIDFESKNQKINLVSEVDKKSESMLIERIAGKFPDHSVLAEERGEDRQESSVRWIIDPLDGTVNYIHGFPIFSISIAVFQEERPELAVVYLPVRDVFFTARQGEGSWRDSERLQVDDRAELSTSIVATGFPYDHQQESEEVLNYLEEIIPRAGGIRRTGSAAYDLSLVAAGIFGGFWEIKLSPWDVAAGILLVKEAGGLASDFSDRDISLSGEEIVAGPPGVHDELLNVLQQAGR